LTWENEPDGHGRQDTRPGTLEKNPGAHCWHIGCPFVGCAVPGWHWAHAVCLVRLLKDPAAHSRQSLWPAEAWYWPTGQAEHCGSWPPCALWNDPAGQLKQRVAPVAFMNWPDGQSEQADWPPLALNVPRRQGWQVSLPIRALKRPGEQAVQLVAEGRKENEPTPHSEQEDWPEPEDVPGWQGEQEEAPG
jgi:hypothetical protein